METLVRAQHGVVSAAQLGAAGMSEAAIRRRVQAGRLRRVHRGVYAVGPMDLTQHGRWMAAVLACGQGAVLSHQSAAVLWKIRSWGAVEVTVPTRGGRLRRPGIVVHRAPLVGHVSSRDRIPVTTPARTLVDLAGAVTLRELERAFDEAERLRLLKLGAIQALLAADPGRRGAASLRVVIGSHRPGSTRTRTYLEEQFFAACNRRGIPRPDVNVDVGQDTVDSSGGRRGWWSRPTAREVTSLATPSRRTALATFAWPCSATR